MTRRTRQPVALPGGVIVSAEKHKGRLVVRLSWQEDERWVNAVHIPANGISRASS